MQETLKTQNRHQVDSSAFSEVKPISWMCKKQTSLSHSSTEAQKLRFFLLTQVYARMEFPLLVFHSSPNQADKARDLAELQGNQLQSTTLNVRSQNPTKHLNLDLTIICSTLAISAPLAALSVNGTPTKNSTYRVARHDHISSRDHAWLKLKDCTSLCHQNNCHPLVSSAPDTDHQHKFLFLFHPLLQTFPTASLVHTGPMILDPQKPCATAEWRINTNPISHMFRAQIG